MPVPISKPVYGLSQPPELPCFRACRRCHAPVTSAHLTSLLASPQIKNYRQRKRAKCDFTKAQLHPNVFTKAYRHTDTMLQTQPRRLNHYNCDTRHILAGQPSPK
ncbi:hypothetical protein BDP55DRAFT_640293 [Colletotrichum godetiae]|uniref:Uncharacterized protein n=1 Tax=Colletotrichum godetiae TaxID=1209918 RepID=A0AAJ0B0W5_9PEZI|nr:uncharacterized protein BDP55DRAFT_640293 [Colletotrichum godetiae]KAK1701047.1 hypothetical protein BDP55DRAFT_640293 [Colletotrichum godetiae]